MASRKKPAPRKPAETLPRQERPVSGGSWVRDAATGKLRRRDETAPAIENNAAPAASEETE